MCIRSRRGPPPLVGGRRRGEELRERGAEEADDVLRRPDNKRLVFVFFAGHGGVVGECPDSGGEGVELRKGS